MTREILQTNFFKKQKKRLYKNQIKDLDKTVKIIIKNSQIGNEKKGDLKGVWVYKFKMVKQQYLLAYEWDANYLWLIAIDVHENFYRDVEKWIKG